MSTVLERPDATATDELEQLWAAPCGSEPQAPTVSAGSDPRPRDRVLLGLDHALRSGWVTILAIVLLFAPQPQAGAAVPIWIEALSWALLLVLAYGAVLLSSGSPGPAYGCGLGAGAAGIVLGLGCRATEHHAGSWWLYETAGFSALTVLAAAALVRSQGVWRSGTSG